MSGHSNICLIGTGTMGKGIVQLIAQDPSITSVFWFSRSEERLNMALSMVKQQWARMVQKELLTSEEVELFYNKIKPIYNYSDFFEVACIIEAVSEDITVKREVFKSLVSFLKPETVVASNTSALSITELSTLTPYPENVVGLHFFNPAPVMKLTEIILGLTTSQQTVRWALSFAKQLGKKPVLVNEAPGFIVNRILIPMLNEAVCILAEGVASEEEIDQAMCLGANHPIGPFKLSDLIGNDVVLSIMDTLYAETRDGKYRAHPLLRKMVRANYLGRKTKHGFYKYD